MQGRGEIKEEKKRKRKGKERRKERKKRKGKKERREGGGRPAMAWPAVAGDGRSWPELAREGGPSSKPK